MATQNDGLFNPILMEDFRDPQDNIMGNAFDNFLNSNAFPSPEPLSTVPLAPAKKQPQPNLMEQVDRVAQTNEHPTMHPDFPCSDLWSVPIHSLLTPPLTNQRERVQSSEKVINGELDMDELCSELKSKAKCTQTGRVMNAAVLDDLLGPDTRPNAHQYVAALNAGYQKKVLENADREAAQQKVKQEAGLGKMFNVNASWFTSLGESN